MHVNNGCFSGTIQPPFFIFIPGRGMEPEAEVPDDAHTLQHWCWVGRSQASPLIWRLISLSDRGLWMQPGVPFGTASSCIPVMC